MKHAVEAFRLLYKNDFDWNAAVYDTGSVTSHKVLDGLGLIQKALGKLNTTEEDFNLSRMSPFDAIQRAAEKKTIIGQLKKEFDFLTVPIGVPTLIESGEVEANFTAQGEAIKLDKIDLTTETLSSKTINAMQAATKELCKNPSVTHVLINSFSRALAKAESNLIQSDADETEASPRGWLYGLDAVSGTTDLGDDIASLVDAFEGNLAESAFLMNPKTAFRSVKFFHNAGINGDIGGVRLIANEFLDGDKIILVEPARIKLAEGGLIIDKSSCASAFNPVSEIKIEGDPNTPENQLKLAQGRSAGALHAFQGNLELFRLTKYINTRAGAGSVAYLSGGTY